MWHQCASQLKGWQRYVAEIDNRCFVGKTSDEPRQPVASGTTYRQAGAPCRAHHKKGRISAACFVACAGVPTGIRTPVASVKGTCPRPLDDGDRGKNLRKKLALTNLKVRTWMCGIVNYEPAVV
jgi:hypothetical protein